MRKMTAHELWKMPAGTVYTGWSGNADGLMVKGESLSFGPEDGERANDVLLDWYEFPLLPSPMNVSPAGNENVDLDPVLDTTPSRWAMYDWDAEFAVYNADDVMEIVGRLTVGFPEHDAFTRGKK